MYVNQLSGIQDRSCRRDCYLSRPPVLSIYLSVAPCLDLSIYLSIWQLQPVTLVPPGKSNIPAVRTCQDLSGHLSNPSQLRSVPTPIRPYSDPSLLRSVLSPVRPFSGPSFLRSVNYSILSLQPVPTRANIDFFKELKINVILHPLLNPYSSNETTSYTV